MPLWIRFFALLLAVLIAPARAQTDLSKMSLEQLLATEVVVTSVSKHKTRLAEAPSAITVITREDIRRSGVTTLPDALRMAPGVQVARSDASRCAVSIRGFNSLNANKLLVLIDGRIVFSPLFAQTHWNAQDVLLEDIDRIEVIRGPGATLWGSNAVNGVINIQTRSARETQGNLVTGLTGNQEDHTVGLRHGGRDGDVFYRVYGKTFRRDGFTDMRGAQTQDDWEVDRAGFRADWSRGRRDAFTVQGDAYDADAGFTFNRPPVGNAREDFSGGNLLGRWTRTYSPTRSLSVQAYYDRTERQNGLPLQLGLERNLLGEVRDTYDLEVQHIFSPAPRHTLVVGATARRSEDRITQPRPDFGFDPASATRDLYSIYAQDEIELRPDKFRLTVGTKLEHNDFTGWEVQPSVRSVYRVSPTQVVWSAISRSVRIPTRVDEDLIAAVTIPGPIPVAATFRGNKGFKSEVQKSYELGYRAQRSRNVTVDVAGFYVDYSRIENIAVFPPVFQLGPPPRFAIAFGFDNQAEGGAYGTEVATEWAVNTRWKLSGSYTALQLRLRRTPGSLAPADPSIGESPEHQFQMRSFLDLGRRLELDTLLYVVNAVNVPDYERLDVRLGWRPRKDLELSLVAQNLISGRHREFVDAASTFIVPSTFARAVWTF
jgi:iron complex outermembrane receptor protein